MKPTRRHTLLAVTAALAVTLAWSGPGWGQGILDTKHNLSTTVGTGANRTAGAQEIYLTAGTTEVCVFCHTPHGADTTVSAPLWNRAVANTAGYTMYSSPTMDSSPSAANMGVSLACLSCHDGTIAFDALRNLPGPGGYDPAPVAGGRNPTGWVWNGGTKTMNGRGITQIAEGGTDLSNDHPIAMIYSAARSPSSTSTDETTGFTAAALNGTRLWVTRAVPGAETISLPLYGASLADGRVQCATCHDPHRKATTFLRASNNDGSRLCRTCHLKDS